MNYLLIHAKNNLYWQRWTHTGGRARAHAFQVQFTRSENGSTAHFCVHLKMKIQVVFLRCFAVNSHKSARLAHNENDKDYFCADVVVYERAPFLWIYINEKITDLIYLFKSEKNERDIKNEKHKNMQRNTNVDLKWRCSFQNEYYMIARKTFTHCCTEFIWFIKWYTHTQGEREKKNPLNILSQFFCLSSSGTTQYHKV